MKVTDRHFLSADHKNHIHVKIWEPEGNVQGVLWTMLTRAISAFFVSI